MYCHRNHRACSLVGGHTARLKPVALANDDAQQAAAKRAKQAGKKKTAKNKETKNLQQQFNDISNDLKKYIDFAELPREPTQDDLVRILRGVMERTNLTEKTYNDLMNLEAESSRSSGNPVPEVIRRLNPVQLGKESRQLLQGLWTDLVTLSSSPQTSKRYGRINQDDFDESEARNPSPDEVGTSSNSTRVLVVGGTGRVGKVLIRKLLLRGYKVRAIVRGYHKQPLHELRKQSQLPEAVELIPLDLYTYSSRDGQLAPMERDYQLIRAVQEVDKVIYCATSRRDNLAELKQVDGYALRDILVRFRREVQVQNVRSAFLREGMASGNLMISERWSNEAVRTWTLEGDGETRQTIQMTYIQERGVMAFRGAVFERRTGAATAQLPALWNPTLENREALVLRLYGDGQIYWCGLTTEQGERYWHVFTTSAITPPRLQNVYLPFRSFNPESMEQPRQLNPADVVAITFAYKSMKKVDAHIFNADRVSYNDVLGQRNSFNLLIRSISATSVAKSEPRAVYISCGGIEPLDFSSKNAIKQDEERQFRLFMKWQAERYIRITGVPFTIIRPGPIVEEAGGYKGIVVSQENEEVYHPISPADLADLCITCLHLPSAANLTFDVAHEVNKATGEGQYKLMVAARRRPGSYLGPALQQFMPGLSQRQGKVADIIITKSPYTFGESQVAIKQ